MDSHGFLFGDNHTWSVWLKASFFPAQLLSLIQSTITSAWYLIIIAIGTVSIHNFVPSLIYLVNKLTSPYNRIRQRFFCMLMMVNHALPLPMATNAIFWSVSVLYWTNYFFCFLEARIGTASANRNWHPWTKLAWPWTKMRLNECFRISHHRRHLHILWIKIPSCTNQSSNLKFWVFKL